MNQFRLCLLGSGGGPNEAGSLCSGSVAAHIYLDVFLNGSARPQLDFGLLATHMYVDVFCD